MITRIWHGTTKAADADQYLNFLLESGVKDYSATPGNQEVRIWRSIEADVAHFWTMTTWDSEESIKAFAGEDISKARYYPEDDGFLLEFEPNVVHYETFLVK
ncbi:MAG TPA: antibiotic biosynthesis monooxygenase [Puia sp.]|jgi:heme-degrading monooxygenase HmoA|nr:antibiotic biosynthesis monooxygenase [Puia sp.]